MHTQKKKNSVELQSDWLDCKKKLKLIDLANHIVMHE